MFYAETKLALLFVVSESGVLSSLVTFFYFLSLYPIKVQGLHCQFSSLLRVLGSWAGAERWGQPLSSRRFPAPDAGSHLLSPPTGTLFLNLMSCLFLSHSSSFLFCIPLRSKDYTTSSLRFSGCWGAGLGPATVQLQVPCTGCWKPSSFLLTRTLRSARARSE